MKTLVTLSVLAMSFLAVACVPPSSTQSPPPEVLVPLTVEGGTIPETLADYVVSPRLTVNDSRYVPSVSYFGKSSISSNYVYGAVPFTYEGTANVGFVRVKAEFKDAGGTLLHTDDSFIWNESPATVASSSNTNSFFTPGMPNGIYNFISNLSDTDDWPVGTTITDIASISLTVSATAYSIAAPYGSLSKVGAPYADGSSFVQDIENDGDVDVSDSGSMMFFEDADGLMYHWTYTSLSVDDTYTTEPLAAGASASLVGSGTSMDYTTLDGVWRVSLNWSEPPEAALALVSRSLGSAETAEDRQLRVRKAMDEAARRAQR